MVRILALDLAASVPGAPAQADNATFGKFHDTLRAAAKIPARCADHGGQVYVTRDGCSCARAGPGLHATRHIIRNGNACGLTHPHKRCPTMPGDHERLCPSPPAPPSDPTRHPSHGRGARAFAGDAPCARYRRAPRANGRPLAQVSTAAAPLHHRHENPIPAPRPGLQCAPRRATLTAKRSKAR